jgi:hypothetical protein
MPKYAVVHIRDSRLYVMRDRYSGEVRVVLPGDFLEVTTRLTPKEFERAKQRLIKWELDKDAKETRAAASAPRPKARTW